MCVSNFIIISPAPSVARVGKQIGYPAIGQTLHFPWKSFCLSLHIFGPREREPRFFWGGQKGRGQQWEVGLLSMPPLASKYVLCVNWRSTMQMLQETMFLGMRLRECFSPSPLYTSYWLTRLLNAWNFGGKEVWRDLFWEEVVDDGRCTIKVDESYGKNCSWTSKFVPKCSGSTYKHRMDLSVRLQVDWNMFGTSHQFFKVI